MKYIHPPRLLTLSLAATALFVVVGCGQSADLAALGPDPIDWAADLDAALEQAKADDKLVFTDFYADWCPPCMKMLRETLRDPAVAERMKDFVAVKVDTEVHKEVARRYGVQALPTLMVLNAEGEAVVTAKGFHTTRQLLALLDQAEPKQ